MTATHAPNLSIGSTSTVEKRIAANTGLMVGAKALAAFIGLFTLIITARALDNQVAFGILIFVHAYMLFFSEVATFQSWQSLIRFGTDDLKNKDIDKFSKLIRFGITLDFISALLAFIGAILLFSIVATFLMAFPDLVPSREGADIGELRYYTGIYCILVLFRQLGTSIGIFRLFDKFTVLAVKALIMPVLRFCGAIYAALSGWGLEGFLLVWFFASLAGYIFLPTMALLELKRRHLLKSVMSAKIKFTSPRIGLWPFVWKSNIDSTLSACNMHLPVLMVMVVFGPAFVAIYRVAEEIAKLLSEGVKLLDQVIYPELARLVSDGGASQIWRLVTRAGAMTLGFGLFMSAIVAMFGPQVINVGLGSGYNESVFLAILLVLAAALLGAAAPLYPVFYAADRPERAIYARGLGLLVYIITFMLLSFTIGRMAPGWAAIAGNIFAVTMVAYLAKRTLMSTVEKQKATLTLTETISAADTAPNVSLNIVGNNDTKLWGLPIREWQTRAYKKIGVDVFADQRSKLHLDINWVLSPALMKAFVTSQKTALVAIDNGEDVVIGLSDATPENAQNMIGQSAKVVDDFVLAYPDDLAGSYDKALRRKEAPYALNVETTPIRDILDRQFASSYKGITDFVTKYVWPWPAFYVTRLCAHLKITPNMVTTLSLIMMFVAMYYFAIGQWAIGFITGWFMTFLDTVDGKLARTTMTYSKWGNYYDHGIDLIHPPFWYAAWYLGLGGTLTGPLEPMFWTLVAIFVGYCADRAVEGIFIALFGFHIHVWRPINSRLRFIIARRNPNMFIFMIGIILSALIPGAGVWGFYAVAIWTWTCILFNIGVIFTALLTKKPVTSWLETP